MLGGVGGFEVRTVMMQSNIVSAEGIMNTQFIVGTSLKCVLFGGINKHLNKYKADWKTILNNLNIEFLPQMNLQITE